MKRPIASVAMLVLSLGVLAVSASGALAKPRHSSHVARRSRTFSFYATVVRADRQGLVVRTHTGETLRFSAAQIGGRRTPSNRHPVRHLGKHHVSRRRSALDAQVQGPVAINIIGLQPGVTVLITETVAPDGSVTVTITLPPSTVSSQENASGVVTDVEDDAFEITTSDGTDLRLHMDQTTLSNLSLQTCATVSLTYHQDTGMLIADSVQVTGASTDGDCAPTYDASGAITQVSGTGISINADQGPMSFSVNSSDMTDGFQLGDVVDVTYTQNGDGTTSATNIQYVEQDANGTVTAVSSKSVTITDSGSGQPETFTADPSQGLQLSTYAFDGVHVGDQIDVTYHQTASGLVADCVDDQQGQQGQQDQQDQQDGN
jgi:hypothetical protein